MSNRTATREEMMLPALTFTLTLELIQQNYSRTFLANETRDIRGSNYYELFYSN